MRRMYPVLVVALVVAVVATVKPALHAQNPNDWPAYGRDPGGTKYPRV